MASACMNFPYYTISIFMSYSWSIFYFMESDFAFLESVCNYILEWKPYDMKIPSNLIIIEILKFIRISREELSTKEN